MPVANDELLNYLKFEKFELSLMLVDDNDLFGVVSEFGKNRTLSERLATRDAIVKHFVIYGILLKLA